MGELLFVFFFPRCVCHLSDLLIHWRYLLLSYPWQAYSILSSAKDPAVSPFITGTQSTRNRLRRHRVLQYSLKGNIHYIPLITKILSDNLS